MCGVYWSIEGCDWYLEFILDMVCECFVVLFVFGVVIVLYDVGLGVWVMVLLLLLLFVDLKVWGYCLVMLVELGGVVL